MFLSESGCGDLLGAVHLVQRAFLSECHSFGFLHGLMSFFLPSLEVQLIA